MTDETVRLARESTKVGRHVAVKLIEQTEQMAQMSHNLDTTNEGLDRTNRTIRGMTGVLGSIQNALTRPKPRERAHVERSHHLQPRAKPPPLSPLDEVGNLLDELKEQATDINKELCKQSRLVERLDSGVVETRDRIVAQRDLLRQID